MNYWDFCKEAVEALRVLRKKYPDTYKYTKTDSVVENSIVYNETYQEALEFVQSVCPSCLNSLPEIDTLIIKAKKISSITECGDICAIPSIIDELKPVTPNKLLDETWKNRVRELNQTICCIKQALEREKAKDSNTYSDIEELPNFSVKGLLGFKYPTYRTPALWELKVKMNEDSVSVNSSGFTTTSGSTNYNGRTIKPSDLFDIKAKPSFNVNGLSAFFNIQWRMYLDYPHSPLEAIYDFFCEDSIIRFNAGVKADASIVLPNISFSPNIRINIDPCLAKYLPPLAPPTNELKVLTLGDGEEFGIYENCKLISHNFGSGFDPNSGFLGKLVKTANETFEKIAMPVRKKLSGLKKNVSFPSYGKGREWSEK